MVGAVKKVLVGSCLEKGGFVHVTQMPRIEIPAVGTLTLAGNGVF